MSIDDLRKEQDKADKARLALDMVRSLCRSLCEDFTDKGLTEIRRIVENTPSIKPLKLQWTFYSLKTLFLLNVVQDNTCATIKITGTDFHLIIYTFMSIGQRELNNTRLIRFSGRTPDHGDNVLYETPVEGIGLPLCFYLYGVSDERRRKKYGLPSASDERHYRGGDYRCIWRGMADNMKVASAILGFLEGRIPPPEFGTTDSRCFIATAAYGNSSDPEILIFKRFRDEILLSSGAGRFAVDLYDRVSPALAKLVRKYRPLRVGLRFILTPMAKILTLFFR